jgi:hypothetical protein
MKKLYFIIILINISINLFSDDTFFYIAGGNIVPAEPNKTMIEMKDEIIYIELLNDHYKVAVDFTFYNNGDDKNLLVGFPYLVQEQAGQYSTSIYNFKTFVNGQIMEHENNKIEKSGQGYGEIKTNYAFTKTVFFPSREITETRVEYEAEYGRASPSYIIATYFYGSGGLWYNSIGKMTINIQNHINEIDAWIYDIKIPNIQTQNHIFWNNNNMQIVLDNIEPGENDTMEIRLGNPLWDLGPMVFRPEWFYYRIHLLDNKILSYLSIFQLKILRNSFYAFYGYNFRDENLKNYFFNFVPSWYSINETFDENMLTGIERANINMILEEELKR